MCDLPESDTLHASDTLSEHDTFNLPSNLLQKESTLLQKSCNEVENTYEFDLDVDVIVNILNGITSENPGEVEEARAKAQALIHSDELDGSGDYPSLSSQVDVLKINDDFTQNKDLITDKKNLLPTELEITEEDFFKDLSPEELERRKGNWKERKVQSDILREHGNVCCVKNNYDEAVRCYSEAIDLIRDSACLYNNRALAYIKLEKYDAAVMDCNRAIFISPFSLKARLYKAKALHLNQDYSSCLACLQEARCAFPNMLQVIDHCEKSLFESDKVCNEAKALGDVFPTEKFMRLAEKYDVSKMTSFYNESPIARNKKC